MCMQKLELRNMNSDELCIMAYFLLLFLFFILLFEVLVS